MRPAAILTAVAGIGIVAGLIAAGGERLGSAIDPQETAAPTRFACCHRRRRSATNDKSRSQHECAARR